MNDIFRFKLILFFLVTCLFFNQALAEEECTIGVAIGKATPDGRPMIWKTRDASDSPDNTIKYETGAEFKFIYVVNASSTISAWMGVNEYGFAILNSSSTDLPTNTGVGLQNGPTMKYALGICKTVDDFESYLQATNITGRSTSANYAVIDAEGNGAIFETGGNAYYKYDANDTDEGYVLRTNFAINGGGDGGKDRFDRTSTLMRGFYEGDSLTYESIIRYQMRDFAKADGTPTPLPFDAQWNASRPHGYIYTYGSICRSTSVSAAVIHGVLPTEDPRLSTMWTMLGNPATTVALPYWPIGDLPVAVKGNPKAAVNTKANEIRALLYDYAENTNYLNSYLLRDENGEGLFPHLFAFEDQIFEETKTYMNSLRAQATLPISEMQNTQELNATRLLSHLQDYINIRANIERDTPPVVVDYSPKVEANETVLASTDIVLKFNWDMDVKSTIAAFSINPKVEGKISFEDDQRTLRFKPDLPLEKSTLYTVKLDKSAKHPGDMSMEEDFIFSFTTKDRNRLVLLDSYPKDGDQAVYADKTQFMLIFDNKLHSATIRDEVKVLDAQGDELSMATRSVKINKINPLYGDIAFELSQDLVAGDDYTLLITGKAMDDDGIIMVDPIEINFTAADIKVTDKTVVENFDVAGKFSFQAEQSQHCSKAALARNTSQKLFGTAAYKLTATFTDEDARAVFSYSNDEILTSEEEKVVGLHIYGDMSGNELQLQFQAVDNQEDVQSVPIATLDFLGWTFQEVALPFSKPYRLTAFKLLRKTGLLSVSSEIWLDDMLLYDKPISGLKYFITNHNILIYPNPVKDIIFVSFDSARAVLLQLYSLDGKLCKSVESNMMSVNEFENGTYLLKIQTENGSWGKMLMISN